MQDRPTAQELLDVIRHFLTNEVMPVLDARLGFHVRVAANLLAVVGREIAGEEAALGAEWTRLAALLGLPSGPPSGAAALGRAVRQATGTLAERIRRGEADTGPFAAAVRAHVRETVREKLRTANPRYLGD